MRGVALIQLLFALVMLVLMGRSNWTAISIIIVGALFMVFCAQETVNDERVEQLKLKASKVGLLAGVVVAMLAYFITTLKKAPMPLSAFDILLVTMLITLGCYYFWRWQDSRVAS